LDVIPRLDRGIHNNSFGQHVYTFDKIEY